MPDPVRAWPSTFIRSTHSTSVLGIELGFGELSVRRAGMVWGFRNLLSSGTGLKLKIAKIIFLSYNDDKGYKV